MQSQITKEFNMILDRKKSGEEGSYTTYLFNKGIEKFILNKKRCIPCHNQL